MGRLAILAVALMLVLAGCSGGGNGGAEEPETTMEVTDAEDGTDDGDDAGTSDGDSDGTDSDSDGTDGDSDDSDSDSESDSDSATDTGQELSFNEISSVNERIASAGEIEITFINGSQELSVLIRNDTENELYRVNNNQQSGERVYYITDGPDAFRNTATGRTLYAEAGNETIANDATEDPVFTAALLSTLYFRTVTWEQTGTRTVDGETRTVYEPLAINETYLQDSPLFRELTPSDVQSFEGEVVSDSDGVLRSGTIRLDTSRGSFSSNIEITIDSSLTVERPDWFDESQVPN
jgi:hypothetical protein